MKVVVNDEIYLGEIGPQDKAAFLEHLADPAIHQYTLRLPYPYREKDADAWIAHVGQIAAEQGQPIHWAIRQQDGKLIGVIGMDSLEVGKSHRAEIGYWLARPHWGRGIMTAVVEAACRFAMLQFGLEKITAHVIEGNVASMRVLEKCGFQLEGRLRRHFLKHGQLRDARLYALFRE